jgi:5-methylthioadenosine/S-adenosylhomocysteine deaminase
MRMHADLISDVTVYSNGSWLPHRDVLIADGLITEIRPTAPAPSGATAVDGSGAYLIPGIRQHPHPPAAVVDARHRRGAAAAQLAADRG